MKPRPKGFLSEDKIDHDGEIFDYISELHRYLWYFVKCVEPSASGNLGDYLDAALVKLRITMSVLRGQNEQK